MKKKQVTNKIVKQKELDKILKNIKTTSESVAKFFELVDCNYKYDVLAEKILNYYPKDQDRARSVINDWVSSYNYCVKSHFKFANAESNVTDEIQSFDAINNSIIANKLVNNETIDECSGTLDCQMNFFQDFLKSCVVNFPNLVYDAKNHFNVDFKYVLDYNKIVTRAVCNDIPVKIYTDKEIEQHLEQMKKSKLIEKSPDQKFVKIMQNSKEYTIVQPMDPSIYQQLLNSIEERLMPRTGWLNDIIIDAYGQLIQSKSKFNVFVFNLSFCQKLYFESNKYDYESVKGHTKKVDLFNKNYVFIPVNLNNIHWTLVAVDIKNKKICYYDSMETKNGLLINQFLQAVKSFMIEQQNVNKFINEKGIEQETVNKGWDTEFIQERPIQAGGSDCGVYVCIFMSKISQENKLPNLKTLFQDSSKARSVIASQLKTHYSKYITQSIDTQVDDEVVEPLEKNLSATIPTTATKIHENDEDENQQIIIKRNRTIFGDKLKILSTEKIENKTFGNTETIEQDKNNKNLFVIKNLFGDDNNNNNNNNDYNSKNNGVENIIDVLDNNNLSTSCERIENKTFGDTETVENNLFGEQDENNKSLYIKKNNNNNNYNQIYYNNKNNGVENNIDVLDNNNLSTSCDTETIEIGKEDKNTKKNKNNIYNDNNVISTLQKTTVFAVKSVFDKFVNSSFLTKGKSSEYLQNGFTVHNFFNEISNQISTVGGKCHQESLIKFVLSETDDLNMTNKGLFEFLKKKKELILEQLDIFFAEKKKKLRQIAVPKGNFNVMSDIIIHNKLINDNYILDDIKSINMVKQTTKRLFHNLIESLFSALSLIYLSHKKNQLLTEDDQIKQTKNEIIDNSLIIFRSTQNDVNDPFKQFFSIMYDTVVTTSTETFSPVLIELVKSSKNKTFQQKIRAHGSILQTLGVNVNECITNTKVRTCVSNSKNLSNSTVPEKKQKRNHGTITNYNNFETPNNSSAVENKTSALKTIPVGEIPNNSNAVENKTSALKTIPVGEIPNNSNAVENKTSALKTIPVVETPKVETSTKKDNSAELQKEIKLLRMQLEEKDRIAKEKDRIAEEKDRIAEEKDRILREFEAQQQEKEKNRLKFAEKQKKWIAEIADLKKQNSELKTLLQKKLENENTVFI